MRYRELLLCVKYFFNRKCCIVVMMVIGHLVKIDFRSVKTDTIIKYIYLYYSEQMTQSENENDHFDLDHFDRVGKCLVYLIPS